MTRRRTIAETTLLTQIAHFERRQAEVIHQVDLLNSQVDAFNTAILDLNTELTRVRSKQNHTPNKNNP